jgi:hypothetical protein
LKRLFGALHEDRAATGQRLPRRNVGGISKRSNQRLHRKPEKLIGQVSNFNGQVHQLIGQVLQLDSQVPKNNRQLF